MGEHVCFSTSNSQLATNNFLGRCSLLVASTKQPGRSAAPPLPLPHSPPLPFPRHRGFNFIEVMFAIILLGLGFIMIAGIFPVALQETNATSNETTGTLVARDALRNIQAIADTDNPTATLFPLPVSPVPPTAVIPFTGALLNAVGTNCYFTSDRRFGWVGFYRRVNLTDPYAQVWVIALQNPNFADASYPAYGQPIPIPSAPPPIRSLPTAFTYTIGPPPTFTEPPPVSPSPIVAELAYSSITGNSYVFLTVLSPPAFDNPVPSAVSGAYILVTQDPGNATGNPTATPPVPPRPIDALTGRLLRLGDPVSSFPADVAFPPAKPTNKNLWLGFQLQPGSDLKDLSEETVAASNAAGTPQLLPVYVIGRAPDAAGFFTGLNQDIAAISAFVRINTSN